MTNKGTHNYIPDVRNDNIKIFINGNFFNRSDACISVFDSGFLLGDGVWEGIRLLNSKFIFLNEHLDRLYYGAKKLSIDIEYNRDALKSLLYTTIQKNKMKTDVHVRLIITRGMKNTPYQHPNANIGKSTIVIIPEYKLLNPLLNNQGINLVTVSTIRGTQNSQDPRLNTLSKINCISACIEADIAGADEGIMLDINNNVATCNSTNFFIIYNNQLWTSTGQYCLPGITRQAIINISHENNIPVYEKDFNMDYVNNAQEAFVTGTFSGIIPVININGNKISGGKPGRITKILQNLYYKNLKILYPEINSNA